MFPINFPHNVLIMFSTRGVTFSHNNFHNVSAPSLPAQPPGWPLSRPSARAPLLGPMAPSLSAPSDCLLDFASRTRITLTLDN